MLPLEIPDHSLIEIIVAVVLNFALIIFAYWKRVLSIWGIVFSFGIGISIAIFADIYWLLTLIIFLAVNFGVTKFRYDSKAARGVGEHDRGRRGVHNVVANGLLPMLIVIFHASFGFQMAALLYITAISIASADTFASELGVLSNNCYLITKPRLRVRPGTDGGVSWFGQGMALFGAFIPSAVGLLFISEGVLQIPFLHPNPAVHVMPMTWLYFVVPFIMGFIGCQIDSLFGATLQKKGYLNNHTVNLSSIAVGLLMTGLMMHLWLA